MKPGTNRMIISVHVPKCGGTSLLDVLKKEYPDRVFEDYKEIPLDPESFFQKDFAVWRSKVSALNAADFPNFDVIHGHFWAGKYDGLFRSPRKITWVRNPVSRLISHYYYWKAKETLPNSLHRLVHQNGFSLFDFTELPIMQNIYTRTFFRGISLDEFEFVGVQEHFAEDMTWLSDRLGWTLKTAPCENQTVHPEYGRGEIDPELERRIRKLNSEDLDLYAHVLERRAQRLKPRKLWFWPFGSPATRSSAR